MCSAEAREGRADHFSMLHVGKHPDLFHIVQRRGYVGQTQASVTWIKEWKLNPKLSRQALNVLLLKKKKCLYQCTGTWNPVQDIRTIINEMGTFY